MSDLVQRYWCVGDDGAVECVSSGDYDRDIDALKEKVAHMRTKLELSREGSEARREALIRADAEVARVTAENARLTKREQSRTRAQEAAFGALLNRGGEAGDAELR